MRIISCHFAIEDGVGHVEIFHIKGEPVDKTQAICKLCMIVMLVKESQTSQLFTTECSKKKKNLTKLLASLAALPAH